MKLSITGLNNRSTGAELTARMNLVLGDKKIVDFTNESVSYTQGDSDEVITVLELSVPYWYVPKDYRDVIKTDGGSSNFYPTDAEKALALAFEQSADDKAAILAEINTFKTLD
jgi:hypothetical protein